MYSKQLELLNKLAIKLKRESRGKSTILASLYRAKILRRDNTFPTHLKHLNKLFSKGSL